MTRAKDTHCRSTISAFLFEMSAFGSSGVTKQGWVCKRGRTFIPSWKNRWFVLTGSKIEYYVDDTLEIKKGEYVLDHTTTVESMDPTPNQFQLQCDASGKMLCKVDSEVELREWMTMVQASIPFGNVSNGGKTAGTGAGSQANTSITQAEMEGWIQKMGSLRRNWKERYMVLEGEKLLYFEDETLSHKRGEVLLDSSTEVDEDPPGLEQGPTGYNFFTVKTMTRKDFIVGVADTRKKDLWISTILSKSSSRGPERAFSTGTVDSHMSTFSAGTTSDRNSVASSRVSVPTSTGKSTCLKEGWMEVPEKGRKYFVLSDTALTMYTNKKKKEKVGSLNLTSHSSVDVEKEAGPLYLVIKDGSHTLTVIVSSEEEKVDWIIAIEKIIESKSVDAHTLVDSNDEMSMSNLRVSRPQDAIEKMKAAKPREKGFVDDDGKFQKLDDSVICWGELDVKLNTSYKWENMFATVKKTWAKKVFTCYHDKSMKDTAAAITLEPGQHVEESALLGPLAFTVKAVDKSLLITLRAPNSEEKSRWCQNLREDLAVSVPKASALFTSRPMDDGL